MDLNISLLLVFILLVTSALKGITILYPLTAGLVLFVLLSLKKGHRPEEVAQMIWTGMRKPYKIYEITLLVGASSSLWMASGTVPYFICNGLSFITPEFFVVSVFLVTCVLGLAIGSSFGTTGIIGVVFMVMARAGGVEPNLAAGAIITAAYFCERSTPLSSCANLVAVLTDTDLYGYLKRLFTGTAIPFIAATALYLLFSFQNPLHGNFTGITSDLEALFNLSPYVSLPAVVVMVCVAFKADVRLTLLLSILTAGVVGILFQSRSLWDMIQVMLTGFHLDSQNGLASSLHSGGLWAMVRPLLIVAVASAYSGIFEGTRMLIRFERSVARLAARFGRFSAVLLTSTLSACFGCSQTFAIITTHQFMAPYYDKSLSGRSDLAQDIGNTAVVIPALIPWNVAFAIPAAILSADAGAVPYAFFLYLVPLFMWGKSIVHSQKKV